MGGCQNYGPFLGTLNIGCRSIIGNPKGTIILTTTYMLFGLQVAPGLFLSIFVSLSTALEATGDATSAGGSSHGGMPFLFFTCCW